MENFIIAAIVVVIVVAVICYLVRAKKRGATCIGCPHAKQCSGKCGACMGNTAPTE
ncbi:MAG: FeoB-associated Cys-rich membrane protein [Ruminococcaceae bacterium]|nr:FeoB-associated Cys-rich membrane protein [Oscillospiraceae bacterium]